MSAYRIEIANEWDLDGNVTHWTLAAKRARPGQPRMMYYGDASGLSLSEANEQARVIGGGARVVSE